MPELSFICPTCSRVFLAARLLHLKVPAHPDALTARPCPSAGADVLDCIDHGLNRGVPYLDQWVYATHRPWLRMSTA